MESNYCSLDWIPFKRFVLRLKIDGGKSIMLGRFRQKRSAEKVMHKLQLYKGYEPEITDTKELAQSQNLLK